MGKIWRLLLLALLVNVALTTAALARTVYLTDGGIIAAQKVWQEEGRVYLLLNRDSLISFSPTEINLKKTFAKTQKSRGAAPRLVAKSVKAPATTTPVVASPRPAAVKPAAAAALPVKTAAVPASSPPPVKVAPAAKVSTPPVKVTPAAKVSTPPPASTPVATPTPVAQKPAPRPRPVVAPSAPEKAPEMMGFVFLGGVLLFVLIILASYWKVFVKAGEAGWASLVPFYNLFVLLRIAGCPGWWFLMFFLPVVNIYFLVVMHIRLAEQFGKSPLFGFALCFLGFIFFPILAFGSATYGGETFDFDEGEFEG